MYFVPGHADEEDRDLGYVLLTSKADVARSKAKVARCLAGWQAMTTPMKDEAPETLSQWNRLSKAGFGGLKKCKQCKPPLLSSKYFQGWGIRCHLLDRMQEHKVSCLKVDKKMRVRAFLRMNPDQHSHLTSLYDMFRKKGVKVKTTSDFLKALGNKPHHRPELVSMHACFASDKGSP